jgi:putative serine protease PepD
VDVTASGISSGSSGFPFSRSGQPETATGTGFEVDARGDILTAEHVVAGAASVTVTLQDRTTRSAKVLGADRSTDAAVLRVNPSGITVHPLPLGSSQQLAVGEPLAVIGDPCDYKRSLSTGVVSAINPGNSGGPVLNAQGQVVGITDQIATGSSGSDGFSGVGFAVPIDEVKAELSQLEHGVHVTYAYLGVGIGQTATQNGAMISNIQAGSPAARAGLRSGDRVVAAGGTPIHGANGLVAAIQARRPDEKLTLTLQRGSQRLKVTVTRATQPRQS